jgi:hypothetical protein
VDSAAADRISPLVIAGGASTNRRGRGSDFIATAP